MRRETLGAAIGAALVRIAGQALRQYRRGANRTSGHVGTVPSASTPRPSANRVDQRPTPDDDARRAAPYPGDHEGDVRDLRPVYRPEPDGEPDAGEVVWAWVPYEDDPSRGKDRPVLLIGHAEPWLLALMLTSKDHDRDAAAEARAGRHWLDVGAGAWDRRGRPSEVRLDRVLQLSPDAVRREGAAMDRTVFEAVSRALADGW